MFMKKLTTIFIIFLFLNGCGTQYSSSGWMGGFSETQLDENMYKVYFSGNAYTSSQSAADMCLLRCAELCLNADYNYFIIIDESQKTTTSTYTTPTQTNTYGTVSAYGNTAYGSVNSYTTGGQTYNMSKPSNSNTIVLFKDKPSNGISYNAKFLYDSLGKKYIKK